VVLLGGLLELHAARASRVAAASAAPVRR